jgi:hypothetical protein
MVIGYVDRSMNSSSLMVIGKDDSASSRNEENLALCNSYDINNAICYSISSTASDDDDHLIQQKYFVECVSDRNAMLVCSNQAGDYHLVRYHVNDPELLVAEEPEDEDDTNLPFNAGKLPNHSLRLQITDFRPCRL